MSESTIYWAVFVGAFFAVAIWESLRPGRKPTWPTERRWANHAALFFIAAATRTLVTRLLPVAVSAIAVANPWGLLNRDWQPQWLQFAATILLLDFAQYSFHRGFHSVSWLWRVHEVHHSDADFDVSTATRFHPIEVFGTQAAHLAVITLLAPPPFAVFLSELAALTLNFFEHANASLPPSIERWARAIFITPDIHRVHHSTEISDQSRNFGQIFSLWDRLFGSYRPQPLAGTASVALGIRELQDASSQRLTFLLREPFRRHS